MEALIPAGHDGAEAQIIEILNDLAESHFGDELSFDFNTIVDDKLSFRVVGESWNGMVNKTVAKFVINAEERIKDLCVKEGIDYPKTKHGLIQIEVKEGSLLAFVKIEKILEAAAKNGMTPEQLITLVMAVAVITGLFTASKIIEKLNEVRSIKAKGEIEVEKEKAEVEKEKIRADERLKMVEILRPVANSERALETPLRGIIEKMEPADRISIGGGEKLTKVEAKRSLSKATRAKPEFHQIDHVYFIENFKTEEGRGWSVKLKYGDVAFVATWGLDHEDEDKFLANYSSSKDRSKVNLALHVNAKILRGKVSEAELVGLGNPREDAVKLGVTLKKSLSTVKKATKKRTRRKS